MWSKGLYWQALHCVLKLFADKRFPMFEEVNDSRHSWTCGLNLSKQCLFFLGCQCEIAQKIVQNFGENLLDIIQFNMKLQFHYSTLKVQFQNERNLRVVTIHIKKQGGWVRQNAQDSLIVPKKRTQNMEGTLSLYWTIPVVTGLGFKKEPFSS